ncbi:MAG: hypothetical protein JSV04_06875, partial [Candidatus Heimdallarchaeota archaeon]
ELPFIHPSKDHKAKVVALVKSIVTSLMSDQNYNYLKEAERIDDIVFDLYSISDRVKIKIQNFCENIMDFV